jgi:uncharacterized membrane protein YgaE (UPF0421/DUF939 family)
MKTRLTDPILWTDVLQLVKTAAAAVIAWIVAVEVLSLPQSFLAPWAALLTVHATVYRTLARGLQQAAAAVAGVLLAFAVGAAGLGVGWLSLGIVVLVGLVIGLARPLRAESTTAAATALVVLLTGYGDDGTMLLARLGDTFVGIAVGLLVNLAVWPPLRDRRAARRIDDLDDRLGALLTDMAAELAGAPDEDPEPRPWVERTRELDHRIDAAWSDVESARESGRLNLRSQTARRMRDARDLHEILLNLEQAVAETRSMARTLGRAGAPAGWASPFRDPWLGLLKGTADALSAADAAALGRVEAELESLGGTLSSAEDGHVPRPSQGALIVNLHHIVDAMRPVAAVQPVRVRTREHVAA